MATDLIGESNAAIPPGLLIRDELAARGMSQRQLATAMKRPVNTINEIVMGRKAVTPRTALGLERALEVPAHIWLRLEADYRLALERERAEGREPAAVSLV
jgi:HTH-type transcriptional regulator/antitoxin HigA